MTTIKKSPSAAGSYRKLEDVLGCKWSVAVLRAIGAGVLRPGALERFIDGISAKVLAERLRKLDRYGLIVKHTYPEVPPRTEYALTPAGRKLLGILAQLDELDAEIGAD